MIILNNLPVIVNGPGFYKTRDGNKVTVHEVKPYPSDDVTAFTVKGSIWKMYRGKYCSRDYDIVARETRQFLNSSSDRTERRNPPVIQRRDFINNALEGKTRGITVGYVDAHVNGKNI